MKQNKLFRTTGNFFILTAVLILAFIYFPVIQVYLFPPKVEVAAPKNIPQDFRIVIPKIGVNSAVIENIDPFNQSEYDEALKKGIAHAKNTQLPGEGGKIFLFAHSSGAPWELTQNNTVFLKLGSLDSGDKITIYRKGREYTYIVKEKKTVWPNEVNYLLDESEKEELILQTCTPIGTDLQRLLVFAELKKVVDQKISL